jgi:hypothetical protein
VEWWLAVVEPQHIVRRRRYPAAHRALLLLVIIVTMNLHSRSKEQREAVRQLVNLVLTRDMSTFNPDRFKHWIKETDTKFRKVSLMLKFEIKDRFIFFRIKEVRNGRIIYQFESSTRVPFDDRDVVLSYEELNPVIR